MSLLNLVLAVLLTVVTGYAGIITRLYVRRAQAEGTLSAVRERPDDNADNERHYRQRADEAKRLIQTFQKFVPRQFVEHFARHGTDALELGRADEDDVAILFCDIRGFTGLSEHMRPQELMSFLNSYFLRMNAPIHQHQGFIDKFIGDAIMALFDHPGGTAKDKASDALKAAHDLRQALDLYNQHRRNSGYTAINVGIGIHYGPVILGTVGSDDRMDTTVIGDSVNIAYRLESLAPVYEADIIVSAQTLETLQEDAPPTRLLDWVRVKGRQTPIEIYEVLSHLPEPVRQARLAINDHVASGITHRKAGRWEAAQAAFSQAQHMAPDDPVVHHHLRVCERYRGQPLDDQWDGALPLRSQTRDI
ncbi:adenylate/guanylate cyclase domain-containing protein [Alteromonas halophila]|uniref:Guanylate cyclase domain-containing protein n=1 Tax=Alteromonas halophila TaxID=516698 RepID=A0A918JGD2_9ALTE|nr:adenylate/guanylate cyclase domain-containing protein [Alteromonas halophila]GGW78659.1 hypothetical protein GCM10007391_09110 [Alteromonas halophila]